MPKKPKKQKLSPAQRSRQRRATAAAIRRIAKEDGITQKQARKKYKDRALIEIVFVRPKEYANRRFIEISPGKFREIPKGKPVREIYAEGPIRSVSYVSKVQKMRQYWELVHILADEYKESLSEARKRIKRLKEKGKSMHEIIIEETGVYT